MAKIRGCQNAVAGHSLAVCGQDAKFIVTTMQLLPDGAKIKVTRIRLCEVCMQLWKAAHDRATAPPRAE